MMLEKYLLKIVSKSNGKSDSLNTWPFDLPVQQIRIVWKSDGKWYRVTTPLQIFNQYKIFGNGQFKLVSQVTTN
jgi:hypothetical protein